LRVFHDHRLGTRYGIGIAPGQRGGCGECLQEIQRGALRCEQRARLAVNFAQYLISLGHVALTQMPAYLAVRIQRAKAALEPLRAAQHCRLARDDSGARLCMLRDQLCGEVEVAHILIQCGADVAWMCVSRLCRKVIFSPGMGA